MWLFLTAGSFADNGCFSYWGIVLIFLPGSKKEHIARIIEVNLIPIKKPSRCPGIFLTENPETNFPGFHSTGLSSPLITAFQLSRVKPLRNTNESHQFTLFLIQNLLELTILG
jgi:hypothetical protein